MSAVECGTTRGYKQHRRAGEPACDACRAANTAYTAAYRASRPERAPGDRALKAAQARALQRLARMHPSMYRALVDEERQKLGLPAAGWSRTA